ncbi:hypothetical protein BH11PLA1_BH11PLA1_22510 [soil metagenome]
MVFKSSATNSAAHVADHKPALSLRVLEPCTMDWDAMRGDQAKRYCDKCELHVHNISAMNTADAARLQDLRARGRVCINGFTHADGRLATRASLPEALRERGASRWRVAAVRAALMTGLTGAAMSLAACGPRAEEIGAADRPANPAAAPRLGGKVAPPVMRGEMQMVPGSMAPPPAPASIERTMGDMMMPEAAPELFTPAPPMIPTSEPAAPAQRPTAERIAAARDESFARTGGVMAFRASDVIKPPPKHNADAAKQAKKSAPPAKSVGKKKPTANG